MLFKYESFKTGIIIITAIIVNFFCCVFLFKNNSTTKNLSNISCSYYALHIACLLSDDVYWNYSSAHAHIQPNFIQDILVFSSLLLLTIYLR